MESGRSSQKGPKIWWSWSKDMDTGGVGPFIVSLFFTLHISYEDILLYPYISESESHSVVSDSL